MKVIGITGPSGSGKTTISKIFKENYNAFIIDADQVARDLSNNTETEYFKEMVNLFGKEVVKEDGHLKRKKVAEIIYKDCRDKNEICDKLNDFIDAYEVENGNSEDNGLPTFEPEFF